MINHLYIFDENQYENYSYGECKKKLLKNHLTTHTHISQKHIEYGKQLPKITIATGAGADASGHSKFALWYIE